MSEPTFHNKNGWEAGRPRAEGGTEDRRERAAGVRGTTRHHKAPLGKVLLFAGETRRGPNPADYREFTEADCFL